MIAAFLSGVVCAYVATGALLFWSMVADVGWPDDRDAMGQMLLSAALWPRMFTAGRE